ncbi:HAAS signaling domain-containing protein [Candidatus Pantoea bituminis]|uniref:HAAS signaling domain-containing protein n=1 Tax=Candidatus Pantoea bituminis TaxID=2831036 RepID=UPI001C0600FD|nr:hypothetical protein [Pantoea bituminis]
MLMSADLPEPAQRYLRELEHELRFEHKYAKNICLEISEHFYEAVECSQSSPEQAALQVTQRFGSPQTLAAEFSAVLITQKLRNTLLMNMGIILSIILGVLTCLSGHQGGPAIFAALVSGGVAWAGLLGIQRSNLNGAPLYHWLCTPMIACQATSFALTLALLWNVYISTGASTYYHAFEMIAVSVLVVRMIHLKLCSRSMCALWRKVRH